MLPRASAAAAASIVQRICGLPILGSLASTNPVTGQRACAAAMLQSLGAACLEALTIPALTRVERDAGDAIYLNPFMLGFAWQRGLVPLSAEAILRAIELNGAAVERNKNAFGLGRIAATETPEAPRGLETLDEMIARFTEDLKAYQSSRYARRYQDFVARIRVAEAAAVPGEERLSRAVKAYKKWADRIPSTYRETVTGQPNGMLSSDAIDGNCLARLKHYRSLIPMAQEVRKPIFHLNSADGAIGNHSQAVRDAWGAFKSLAVAINERLENDL